MNTIIWIGLFMFIMGTIILVSSYQSIFNQSAKAGGIIAALCIYLLLDGVAVMLWGNHNYIIALFYRRVRTSFISYDIDRCN